MEFTDEFGQCLVCGDRSAGKHYGVMACYGCKGFFRRTIRSAQTYTCRFQQKCSIDKDQRNACRFCRFQRCLQVGMEPDAIRPDRDIIGKQKNPRRKKILKRQDSSLSISYPQTPEMPVEDSLISILIDIELRASAGQLNNENIGFTRVKADPDVDLASLFVNAHLYIDDMFEISYGPGRVASTEELKAAFKRKVFSCIHWIDALFSLAGVSSIREKVCVLKSVFAQYCLFAQAARTAQISIDPNTFFLCNRAILPRVPPRDLIETNLLANNMIARVLDELVLPTRRIHLSECEAVALTAMIILNPEAPGLSPRTMSELSLLRDRVQTALFQTIRERLQPEHTVQAVTSRFGNLLLLLPPLARVSTLFAENVHFARMFGTQIVDPILVEVFSDEHGMQRSDI
ncbi:unnamed protein product, partial [Mesorhabditis belari]|uniref:Uncharacterized protein n=1 Tax=Mesorhabditis belari TaxID=2138241 RepID=A0AAF3EUB2_9BILA